MAINVLENLPQPQKISVPQPDLTAAQHFLNWLDPTTSEFCFRTFDDKKKNGQLTKNFTGTLTEHLPVFGDRNKAGAGVFVIINKGGHRDENITRIRYVFADTDGAPLAPLTKALEPHLVIESSPERYHVYWRVIGCEPEIFRSIQEAIADKFGTDKVIKNPSRVMRLPGYFHQKATPFQVKFVSENEELAIYTLDQIIEGLGLNVTSHNAVKPQTSLAAQAMGPAQRLKIANLQDMNSVEEMLSYLEPFEDYDRWIKVGFMLADEFGEDARDLFLRWSRGDLLRETKS